MRSYFEGCLEWLHTGFMRIPNLGPIPGDLRIHFGLVVLFHDPWWPLLVPGVPFLGSPGPKRLLRLCRSILELYEMLF